MKPPLKGKKQRKELETMLAWEKGKSKPWKE